ncbi:YggS family pyridoxal phosphate-dependent enzyme [Salinispirillum sp. LH 10-3-1]|uniref:Pyridoxal phosphate homeostasis protein n=1 Tax=Salinispirillum sp. LH 10-3-1 TaxID=2952525 RepID=A0AB38YGR1_9GAMM
MANITERWRSVREKVDTVAKQYGRSPENVRVLAVSKTFPAHDVEEAWQAGAREFGENYVQEGIEKIQSLPNLAATWHFIGPLQSNKTRPVATHFDWVHTIDRLKIAQRLNDQRPDDLPPLKVCLQVNISADPDKAGVREDEILDLAEAVQALPRLELRGLMTIPALDLDAATLAQQFQRMQAWLERLQTLYPAVDTLSMGMSDDLELAVQHGSTCVRIGRGIFGHRAAKLSTGKASADNSNKAEGTQ